MEWWRSCSAASSVPVSRSGGRWRSGGHFTSAIHQIITTSAGASTTEASTARRTLLLNGARRVECSTESVALIGTTSTIATFTTTAVRWIGDGIRKGIRFGLKSTITRTCVVHAGHGSLGIAIGILGAWTIEETGFLALKGVMIVRAQMTTVFARSVAAHGEAPGRAGYFMAEMGLRWTRICGVLFTGISDVGIGTERTCGFAAMSTETAFSCMAELSDGARVQGQVTTRCRCEDSRIAGSSNASRPDTTTEWTLFVCSAFRVAEVSGAGDTDTFVADAGSEGLSAVCMLGAPIIDANFQLTRVTLALAVLADALIVLTIQWLGALFIALLAELVGQFLAGFACHAVLVRFLDTIVARIAVAFAHNAEGAK